MRHDNPRQPVGRQSHVADQKNEYAFRRSRTITGSAASSVRAAGENRGQLQSSRLHEHHLRKHRRKLSLYLGLTIMVAGLLWYVVTSYVSAVTVGTTEVTVARTAKDDAKYTMLVDTYFQRNPLERLSFLLDDKALSDHMMRESPEIQSATLSPGESFGVGSLTLEFRQPVVVWTMRGQQYFVDSQGVAYTTNYYPTPGVVVNDKSGISTDAGVVASSKLLRFIGRVITIVNQAGVGSVVSVELPMNSARQVDFKLSDRDYIIKAHMDRDPAGQAADIVSAVRYVESKGIAPKYLDVRVSSKAFYRDAR